MIEFRFDSLQALFAMNGHGLYVWLCFGLALTVVLGNYLALRRSRRLFLRDAKARLQRRSAQLTQAAALKQPVQANQHAP